MKLFWISLLLIYNVLAVDRSKFRTCKDTNFCAYHMARQSLEGEQHLPGLKDSFDLDEKGVLRSGDQIAIFCMASGAVRVKVMDKTRYESGDVLVDETVSSLNKIISPNSVDLYGCQSSVFLEVTSKPYLSIKFRRDASLQSLPFMSLSDFIFEHATSAPVTASVVPSKKKSEEEKPPQEEDLGEILDWGEDGKPIYKNQKKNHEEPQQPVAVEEVKKEKEEQQQGERKIQSRSEPETFGGVTDNKPRGPMAVGNASKILSVDCASEG